MVKEINFLTFCSLHYRVAIQMLVSSFFIKLLCSWVLGKHWLVLALPAFQLGLFPEVLVVYPSTFCVTLKGSRTCTLNFLHLRHPLGRHSTGLLVTRLKKCFSGLFCTWLLLASFDGPEFLYWKRESASCSLSLCPPNNSWCWSLLLYPSCPSLPTYSSFILG